MYIIMEDRLDRRLHYIIVYRSKLRDVYFTSTDEIDTETIIDELEKFPTLELIQNGTFLFVVKKSISQENKTFLSTFNPSYKVITPEENKQLGRLLGYSCDFVTIKNKKRILISVLLGGKNHDLFAFNCDVTPENLEVSKALHEDIKQALGLNVIMTVDGVQINEYGTEPMSLPRVMDMGGRRKSRKR